MAKNDYQKYNDRLNLAHKKFSSEMEDNIKKWRKYYNGEQWTDAARRQYKFPSVDNMIFSNIRTIMPSINFNNPRIYVQARKKPHRVEGGIFDTIAASAIFEIIINYYFRELEIRREINKCLVDALLGPWGVIQIGYTAEIEKIKDDKLLEVNEIIKSDSPFATRVSPLNFRVDPEAKDSHLQDAAWVAVKWTKSLEELKNNDNYKNLTGLKPNAHVRQDFTDTVVTVNNKMLESDHDFARIEGWDIWDKRNNRLVSVVKGHDKLIQDREWPLEYDGFPFETLYFNENPDDIWPVSDTQIILAAQDELNRLRSLQLAHIKNISQRKYVARENAFDPEELDKLTDGPDGAIAMSKQAVDTAITNLRDNNISQDFYMAINTLKNNIREMGGVAQFEQGIAQKFDTATEPQLMAQGLTIKRAERSAILEDFIHHVIRKLGRVIQQTLEPRDFQLTEDQFQLAQEFTPNKLEKIAGDNASQIILPWLKAGKDDIRGDYNFDIDVGTTQPINQEKRKADAVSLAQILAENPFINQVEAVKRILEAFDIKDIEKLLRNPDEVAQEQQAAQQAQQQTILQERQMKDQTDLAKTKMKSDTSIQTTIIKERGNLTKALLSQGRETGRMERREQRR